MKKTKILLSVIFSFILVFVIIFSTLLIIFEDNLKKENMLKKFEEINLYNSVYEDIRAGFENYIYQSGLDINMIDKICTKEKVKNDVILILDSAYERNDYFIDTTEIRTNLDNEINEYVESKGRKLSNQEKENIKEFEDLIENSYIEEVSLYKKGASVISKNLPELMELINKTKIIIIVISFIILIILSILNFRNILVAGAYIGTSFLASGSLLIIAKNIVVSNVDIDNLVIFTKALSNFIVYYINFLLNTIQKVGIVYVIIAIFIIIFMNIILLNKNKTNNKA